METVDEMDRELDHWKAPLGWTARARMLFSEWESLLDGHKKETGAKTPTYAQVVDVVNRAAKDNDTLIAAWPRAVTGRPSS